MKIRVFNPRTRRYSSAMINRLFIAAFLTVILSVGVPTPIQAQDAVTTTESTRLSEAAARKAALKAKEQAELRIEEDMVTMGSLVEALAKNLGQLHYLRTLCFGKNDQKWRIRAGEMMELESPGDVARRRELVRAFNAGYYQEESRHAKCSQSVSIDAAALAENGRSVATMLGDPYREY